MDFVREDRDVIGIPKKASLVPISERSYSYERAGSAAPSNDSRPSGDEYAPGYPSPTEGRYPIAIMGRDWLRKTMKDTTAARGASTCDRRALRETKGV